MPTNSAAGSRRSGSPPPRGALNDELVRDFVELFKLLGDETRLKLLLSLRDGPRNVGELCRLTGHKQPTVSHHLSLLRRLRVITYARQGKEMHYALSDETLMRLTSEAVRQLAGRTVPRQLTWGAYVLRELTSPTEVPVHRNGQTNGTGHRAAVKRVTKTARAKTTTLKSVRGSRGGLSRQPLSRPKSR